MPVGAVGSKENATQPRRPKPAAPGRRSAIWALIGIISATWLCVTPDVAAAQKCIISADAANNGAGVTATSVAVAANIAANVFSANTAFLTQSTAFVSAPGNPQPDQPGGGVWGRAVGGQVDIKSTSSNNFTIQQPPGTQISANSVPCNTTTRSTFDGVQVGSDVARLNLNGWNVHLGATAGALYFNNSAVGGSTVIQPFAPGAAQISTTQVPFASSAQVPFIGAYATATYGGFFADFLIRADAYQMSFDSASNNLYGQKGNAHGIAVGGSIGYNYQIPNAGGWFIEPSAGLLYSRVKVDDFNLANSPTGFVPINGSLVGVTLPGTLSFNDITQTIGRFGLRVGTSFSYGRLTLQPFAAASVWHDFAGNATATFTSCPGCLVAGPIPALAQNTYSGTNIGTYGQYSLGISGALANTGWAAFARVDYRNGSNLTGWDGTGGFRYSFTPEAIVRTAMPVKAPVLKAPPSPEVTTWNGFYVGAFGGAEIGRAHWGYPVGAVDPRVAGILGGVNAGYNWQNGPWVFGLEGDVTGSDAKGGIACNALSLQGGISSPLYEMTCNARSSWIATVTPRIGLAWDRALFYVKGGLAVAREEFSATCNFGPTNGVLLSAFAIPGQSCAPVFPTSRFSISNGFSASDVRAGWTIGSGVQFALTQQWSTKIETDYTVFDNHTLTASDGNQLNLGMHVWQTKIGFNYRFGGPVAAAY